MNSSLCAVLVPLLTLSGCGQSATPKKAKPVSDTVSPDTVVSEVVLQGQTDILETGMGPLKIAPIWHGTLSFAIGTTTIVIDPWTSAPEGRLPKADLVLITDIHYDHFDKAALEMVRKPNTVFVAPQVVADNFPEAVVLANGSSRTELGIGIRAVPMYNNERGPEPGKLYHDKGRGNGYVLTFGDTQVYISGDTACVPEMRELQNIDLAFVCMNLPYTMTPEEAATCVAAFQPKIMIPFHYRGSDLNVFQTALQAHKNIEVRIRDFYKK